MISKDFKLCFFRIIIQNQVIIMKKLFKNVNERWKEYALAGCITVTVLVFLLNIGTILKGVGSTFRLFSPVFLGVVIAYVLNPLAVFLCKKLFGKMKKEKAAWGLSVFLSIIIVLGFLTLVVSMLIPQVAGNVQSLLDNAEGYLDSLIAKYENHPLVSGIIGENINDYLIGENGVVERIAAFIAGNIKTLISTASSFGGKAANVAVGVILAMYFLIAKESVKNAFSRFFKLILSPLKFVRGQILFDKFNTIFSKYIVCELLDSLFVGTLNFLFMIICGMPNALFVSVIVALTNLAPTFGPIAGAVFASFILLLSAPGKVVLFLIFTVALQIMDGYVVKPKFFGGALNVPGVLILLSIIICGKIMGVPGMLVAIPAAAILVYCYNEVFISRMELKRELEEYKKEIGDDK